MAGIPSVITLGQVTTDTVSLQIVGPVGGGRSSVALVGDVNGDGYSDVILGLYGTDLTGRASAGTSYVLFGDPALTGTIRLEDLPGSAGFRIDGAAAGDSAGSSVASAGDVNGDGFLDMIISANGASPSGRTAAGSAFVVYGGASGPVDMDLAGLSAQQGFRIDGAAAGDGGGLLVATAGDVNGDGYADMIVGAWQADPGGRPDAGSSYVVFGRAGELHSLDLAALAPSDGFRIDGAAASDNSGYSVASAGDVNGDGYADLLIGAPLADPSFRANAGSTYLIYGKASGFHDLDLVALSVADGIRIDGALAADQSGRSVASAGDVNNDGFADLLIGAWQAQVGDGSIYVVYGGPAGPSTMDLANLTPAEGFRINGAAGEFIGTSVASAGDVNGDGLTDMIIGAPLAGWSRGFFPGSSYVVYGQATGRGTLNLSHLSSAEGFRIDGMPGEESGNSVSSAGDLNGDGYADVLIGTDPVNSPQGVGPTNSYVIFGEATTPVLRVAGPSGAALYGGDFDDTLLGGAGSDFLFSGDGRDVLLGGAGRDTLLGGDGTDLDAGGDGADVLYAGDGDDGMFGEAGDDILGGNAGRDTLVGGDGDDLAFGGADDDTLYGQAGADHLRGDAGDDILVGDAGRDTLVGGEGHDLAFGGGDDDILYGEAGADHLRGDAGDDTLIGGAGDDTLVGGAGVDVFVFNLNHGLDWIPDFTAGLDHILLQGSGYNAYAQLVAFGAIVITSDTHATISTGSGTITLDGTGLAALATSDFFFG